jgi:tight adherence protein B
MSFEIDPLLLFYAFAGLSAVLAAEAVYLLFHNTRNHRTRVNRRLAIAGKEGDREKVLVQLRRERGLSADGDHLLPLASLDNLIMQSGVTVKAARLVPALAAVALVAFAVLRLVRGDLVEALAGTVVAVMVLPFVALVVLRQRRRNSFGAQFPEAIDIIVRSLRAGHPVPVAIGMVARELPDPVGTEFGIVADEITYGSDLETAMRNMHHRVGQEDLPLFVTSVAIQATTGGNLSLILDNLGKVIRERFKMRRKIRGLSAEGRAGAWILTLIPIIVFVIVNVLSPEFYGDVWNEQTTQFGLGAAMVWMLIGNLIMRRMINFKI